MNNLQPIVMMFVLVGMGLPAIGQNETDGGTSRQQIVSSSDLIEQLGEGVSVGKGPQALGANKTYVKFNKKGSKVTLKLPCTPGTRNYLTVKLWGESGSKGSKLKLVTGDGKRLVSKQRMKNPHPDQFYYHTRPLPTDTTSESPATVTLVYQGKQPGLQLYDATIHTNPFYRPPSDALHGKPLKLGEPRSGERKHSEEDIVKHWRSEANRGFDVLMNGHYTDKGEYPADDDKKGAVQIFGEKYQRLIEQEQIPAWTYGAILGEHPGATELPHPYNKIDSEVQAWGGFLIRSANMNPGTAFYTLNAMARAYVNEWSDYYRDQEVLKRFAAAMDFYARAQGSGGIWKGPTLDQYEGGGWSGWPSWIGAPEREPYTSNIFSMGQKFLWPAYNMMHDALQEKGLLEKKIDHDLDPDTPKVTRRRAYTRMAKRSFTFFVPKVRGVRPICNQVLHNYNPLAKLYKSLTLLVPEQAKEKRAQMRKLGKIAAGVIRQPQTGHYMFSPDGLSNEHGYAHLYGSGNPPNITQMARITGYDFARQRVHDAFRAWSQFLYLGNDRNGHRVLKRPVWISQRNFDGVSGRPGYVVQEKEFGGGRYAIEELGAPAAVRLWELYRKHNRGSSKLEGFHSIGRYGLWSAGIRRAAMRAEYGAMEVPDTDYRLPTERTEPTAYVDPYLETGAIHHGETTFHFHVLFRSKKKRARVSYKRPAFNRYGIVTVNEFGPKKKGRMFKGAAAKTLLYGPYFIVLNGSETASVEVDVPAVVQGKEVKVFESGKRKTLPDSFSLKPMSSHAFYITSFSAEK